MAACPRASPLGSNHKRHLNCEGGAKADIHRKGGLFAEDQYQGGGGKQLNFMDVIYGWFLPVINWQGTRERYWNDRGLFRAAS